MRLATDPIHTFKLPFPAQQLRQVRASYQQNGATVLTKVVNGPFQRGDTISIQLTQEDTNSFAGGQQALVQLRVITLGGSSAVSDPISFYVGDTFDKEVIE